LAWEVWVKRFGVKETLRRILVVGCYVGAFAMALMMGDRTFLENCGLVIAASVLHKCVNWIFKGKK
jgi:hypothetical protein